MAKSLAIMQPYFFPYLGYFQLVDAVDEFIFLDDVNFIKKGWINRNNLLVNNQAKMFSIPLLKPSQNKLINEIDVHPTEFLKFKKTFLSTLQHNYSKYPFYAAVMDLIDRVIEESKSISELAIKSVKATSNYLQIKSKFLNSSDFDRTQMMKGQDRILNLAKFRNASAYTNLSGGKKLYETETFYKEKIDLKFISTDFSTLKKMEETADFKLSMIHLLMSFSPQRIREFLKIYNLT